MRKPPRTCARSDDRAKYRLSFAEGEAVHFIQSFQFTQPRTSQFTNHSMSAWPLVLHCKVVHDNLFPT